jgi:xanthine dehydrogenase small subunit
MPALLVLDASVELRAGTGRRTLPLNDFYLDYMQNALQPAEFIEKILIPVPVAGARLESYKVSKRFDQDISAVCGAYRLELSDGHVAEIRIAYGGMAAIPQRAQACEEALRGKPWNEAQLDEAMQGLDGDFSPLTDMRSTAKYRRQICRNMLRRFYLETTGAAEQGLYGYGR